MVSRLSRFLFLVWLVTSLSLFSVQAWATIGTTGNCSGCHSATTGRMNVSGSTSTTPVTGRLDGGSSAALPMYTVTRGSTIPLTMTVTNGADAFGAILAGTLKSGTREAFTSGVVKGIKNSLTDLLSFTPDSLWSTVTGTRAYQWQASGIVNGNPGTTWTTAKTYTYNLNVGATTPADIYTLTFYANGTGASGEWMQPQEILINVLAGGGNDSVLAPTTASIALGRMLTTAMKLQSVTVTRTSGTSNTGFTATPSNGATATSLTNNVAGTLTGLTPGTLVAGVANVLGANTLGSISIQNLGNDGTGAGSAAAGQGSAQAAITIPVTGTVVEQRKFATPSTVALGNVLAGSRPTVAVTSNNTNPDSNHATNVTVNGVPVNSGAATSVPFAAPLTTSGTFTNASATPLPVVTAEAAGVGDVVTYPSISVTYSGTVGNATATNGNSPGYGPALTGAISSPFTVLSSKVTSGVGSLGSEAKILGVSGASGTASMQWRTRSTGEQTGQHPLLPSNIGYLTSDVVDLTGVSGTFVMSMSYAPDASWDLAKETGLINKGYLCLAYRDPTGAGTNWAKAGSASSPVVGAWNGTDFTIGDFGVDPSTHTAWAVVNGLNGEFAVVPEPGTLALLIAAGMVAIPFCYQRSRRMRKGENC